MITICADVPLAIKRSATARHRQQLAYACAATCHQVRMQRGIEVQLRPQRRSARAADLAVEVVVAEERA